MSSRDEKGKGNFCFSLPKIPVELLYECSYFFRKEVIVATAEGRAPNEVFAQVFYCISQGRYYLYLPSQHQSHTEVVVERNIELESDPDYILVMDCHSHNVMEPFFSSIDDADEKETRLFLVAGNYGCSYNDTASFILRMGNGGLFKELKPSDIFRDLKFGNLLDYPIEDINVRLRDSFIHPLSKNSILTHTVRKIDNRLISDCACAQFLDALGV